MAFAAMLAMLALPLRAYAQDSLHTNPLNLDPAVRAGYDKFYNLDYDGALKIFDGVSAAHPNDPMAWDYVLEATIFRELYHQDLLDTTYYAHNNFLSSKRDVSIPQQTRDRIEQLTNHIVDLSDARLKQNPNDKNALFARSYGRGFHASFIVLADHSFATGAHQGLQARSDSEAVLKIDPQYADADMAIGIQEFAVATLPRYLRFIVGFMGVGGTKEKGLALLRESASHGVATSVEARTALSLFLRHDGQYAAALDVQRTLAQQYPHNYLFRLEVANLLKDEGTGPVAIAEYQNVLNDARKPGYFVDPRLQMAWFGMADTQRGWNMLPDAASAYVQAAQQPNCSDWLRRRAELNAGEVFDMLRNHSLAMHWYELAAAPGGDQSQAADAHKYMQTPYTGK